MSGNKPRTIKLYCPSLKKVVQFVAWDQQRLDLGSIARTFGLDPSTLKLNGHFIARGVDLIASSVTWRSLLSFFSSKGLSTGKEDRDALIVDGKHCKVGGKRAHDPQDAASGIHYWIEHEDFRVSRISQHEEVNLLKNKKLKESNSGCKDKDLQVTEGNGFGFKRKQRLEVVRPLKKLKIDEINSDFQGRDDDFKRTTPVVNLHAVT